MKNILPILIGAALLPLAANGQTAYSNIAGYVSLGDTAGSVAIPANTDVVVSIPLLKAAVYVGAVSSNTADTITFSGTPGLGDLTTTKHVIVVENGPASGVILPITSNTASTVTVDVSGAFTLAGLAATNSVSIRPAWTVQSFMAGASSLSGVTLYGYSNSTETINNSADQLFFPVGGGNWEDGDGNPANDYVLYPGEGFIVRTGADPVNSFVVTGDVPTCKSYVAIGRSSTGERDTFFGYVSPVGEALGVSNIGIAAGDVLYDYNNSVADINKSGIPYFFTGTSWEDGDGNPADTFQLQGGKAYIYRRVQAGTSGYDLRQDEQTYIPSL